MNFTYTASGGVLILGCVNTIELIQNYSCTFAVGSSPYVLGRALRGDLEKVTIKKIGVKTLINQLEFHKTHKHN